MKLQFKEELIAQAIDFEEGMHSEEKILSASLIIKSPGISEKTDIVRKARAKNIQIIDEIEFAHQFINGKIIAITGTNGKTTTTLLVYHLLKSAGFQVALAGNVGESLARKVAAGDHEWYVLEISSFQLDGSFTFKPHIAILLNITPDHLDRYEYKLENYVNSKFRLIQNMGMNDYFIYYQNDPVIKASLKEKEVKSVFYPISLNGDSLVNFNGENMSFTFGKDEFQIEQSDTTLQGQHNLINTMAAVSAAYLAGVSQSSIRESLKTFKNAPHRLEYITTINGVDFINDSKATNIDSVVYGLGSYEKPLIWIAGGVDKGNDYDLIKDEVRKKVKALICLGKDNSKLKNAFRDIIPQFYELQNVDELVHLALKIAAPGDVVLLSPACASFDLFKNYEDRGDQFRQAVLEMKQERA